MIANNTPAAATLGDLGAMRVIRASILLGMQGIRVPSEVLSLANEAAFNGGAGTIVTAIVASLNSRQRTLTFAKRRQTYRLGSFRQSYAADYVIALPADAMLVFYTDGMTEHDRDPIRGEMELAEAARRIFERPNVDAAQAIARQLLGEHPVLDDAATMVVRMLSHR